MAIIKLGLRFQILASGLSHGLKNWFMNLKTVIMSSIPDPGSTDSGSMLTGLEII